MPADLSAKLAQRLGISRERVPPACALLDSGLSPVFIAHYRKPVTGGMDETTLERLAEARREFTALADARQRAVRIAEAAGAATPEFRSRLEEADDLPSIEDLVRPLRPKRRTAGLVACEKGLEPLASYAWSAPPDGPDLATKAAEFVNPEKEVRSPDEALAGAGHILADRLAESPRVRGAARRLVLEEGILKAQQAPGGGKQAAEFRAYFQFQEPLSHLPPHRILAVSRGERSKALKVAIEMPPEALKEKLFPVIFPAEVHQPAPPPVKGPPAAGGAPAGGQPAEGQAAAGPPAEAQAAGEPPAEGQAAAGPPAQAQAAAGPPAETRIPVAYRFREFLEAVATDALQRLVLPAVEREIRRQLVDRADDHAIDVFCANLRSLLMTRPVRGKRVLAIQPGFRTGCKVVALDAAGALLGETIIYPLEPQKKVAEGKAALFAEIERHAIGVIAIGNGTGCREIEQFVSELIQEQSLAVEYAMVSEAGASAYADSDLAKQEFPNLDAAIRAAISIGRRLQDPLAEFVRIDPRAIGVGLYQHDVNQQRLTRALNATMESCVAAVGADANTAPPTTLRHIPGVGEAQAAALVARRQAAPLASREDLKTLPDWDERTFLTAAGFLRIRGACPLDATRVHPESYPLAERLLVHLGHRVEDLATPESAQAIRKRLTGLSLEPLAAELQAPLADLMDLVGALQHPDYDPRREHHGPILRKKMRELTDLQPGMWVKGTVRNVVDFGAFVDIGLKEDGLVHISQFSRRYVRNPLKFLHVGDVVDVRIVSIEADKRRIALTLIPETPPPKKKTEAKPPVRRPPRGPRPAGAPRPAGVPRPASPGRGEAKEGAPAEAAVPPPISSGRAESGEAGASRPTGVPRPVSPARADGGRPRPPSDQRRPPRQAASGDRRPAPASRDGAAGGRGDRPRGPRSDRHFRSGPPRIIVSKPKTGPDNRPPDEAGRPKIRWAYYESDPNQEEFEDVEAEVAPAAPPAPPAAENVDDAGVAPSPQVTAELATPIDAAPPAADAPTIAPPADPPPAETPKVEPPAPPEAEPPP
jgi:uncharacterized protein